MRIIVVAEMRVRAPVVSGSGDDKGGGGGG